MDIIINKGYI
jgi:hypothetical protein